MTHPIFPPVEAILDIHTELLAERDAAIVVLSLAGGEMSEQAFQHWVAANSYKI